MPELPTAIPKPRRWDVPLGPDMTEADVDRVLSMAPFSEIDPDRFGPQTPLREIIRNDCRIVRYRRGDIIVREGDYGGSLFFIMEGNTRVAIALPPQLLGRGTSPRKGLLRQIAQLWTNHRTVEQRDAAQYGRQTGVAARHGEGSDARIFLQDVPAVLDEHQTARLSTGEFFGELAAFARIPRTATVFAEEECELLEMRWQGFRDIRRRADAIRKHVDQLYRDRALIHHLQSTPIFRDLSRPELEKIADQVAFETLGDFDWFASYQKLAEQDPARRLAHEPVIAAEGDYPNGLIMIRAGFVRVSRRFGDGERTLSYLGRGQTYGLSEITDAIRTHQAVPLRATLRAVGYVDILRVPTRVIESFVSSGDGPPAGSPPGAPAPVATAEAHPGHRNEEIDPGMLEFLVENRFINGSSTMLIDLDRCTGCDDCVRACAAAHDDNPRFIRHGRQYDHHMVANACMHCIDPVCMIGCPTGAIHRSESGGEVVINDATCIGCATCANSCPYENIRMVEIRNPRGGLIRDDNTGVPIIKATKCDLSLDQIGDPPCQRACPHDALKRIKMSDTEVLAGYLNR